MGDLTKTGSNFNKTIPDREALSENEIDRRLSQPIGESSGVISLQMDARGNTVGASNLASSRSVVMSGGPPTNLHQTEIKQLQNEVFTLHNEASRLPDNDPQRTVLAARASELEVKGKTINAKEQREIEAANASGPTISNATLAGLHADLHRTQQDAADRKERSRGKLML